MKDKQQAIKEANTREAAVQELALKLHKGSVDIHRATIMAGIAYDYFNPEQQTGIRSAEEIIKDSPYGIWDAEREEESYNSHDVKMICEAYAAQFQSSPQLDKWLQGKQVGENKP